MLRSGNPSRCPLDKGVTVRRKNAGNVRQNILFGESRRDVLRAVPVVGLNRIYILRDGLDSTEEHTLSVRISEKRNELSQGNNCRIVYFGLSGDPRTPKGVDVDGVYFDGSKGYGPEK